MRPPKILEKKQVIDVIIPYINIDVIEMDEDGSVFVRTLSGRAYWVGEGVEHMQGLKDALSKKDTNWLRLKE